MKKGGVTPFFLLSIHCLLAACSSPSAWQGMATAAHLETRVDATGGLPIRWLAKDGAARRDRVRVYIEGDGRPWIGGGNVLSPDPTPRTPYVLSLMISDATDAIYLGRPCYFGLAYAPGCQPKIWTDARFSQQVIDAMAASLSRWLTEHPKVKNLTLVGHSGGGVLAILLAERVVKVDRVIALASPVSLQNWVRLHGYRPLSGSLDPATQGPLRAGVQRLLVLGEQDENVPPEIFAPIAKALGIPVMLVVGEGHLCCHADDWRQFIQTLDP